MPNPSQCQKGFPQVEKETDADSCSFFSFAAVGARSSIEPAAPWPAQETCWGLCQHLAKTIGPNHQVPDVSVAAGGLGQGMTMGEHSRGTSISETCLLRDAPSEAPHRHCTERFCWSFSHHPKLGAAPAGNLCLSAQVGQCEFNRPLPLRGQFYCALKGAVNMSRKFASEVFKEKEIPN